MDNQVSLIQTIEYLINPQITEKIELNVDFPCSSMSSSIRPRSLIIEQKRKMYGVWKMI